MRHQPLKKVIACGSLLTGMLVFASCGGSGTPDPSPSPTTGPAATTESSSATPAPASTTPATPTSFTSKSYAYTVTLPAGWLSVQAHSKWDGKIGLDYASASIDRFIGNSMVGSWAVSAPWKRGLAADTRYLVRWNHLYHGDTCPEPRPESRNQVTIGGQEGVLLAYNCGILINLATTVHHGVAFLFVFRDTGVHAATDPTDHATFLRMLRSVRFAR